MSSGPRGGALPVPSRGDHRGYLVALLAVILAFNGIDGLALGLVLQNIKVSLHLTDSQLGVLTGIAFSLFYSIFGIPIGRWADRGNRVTIIGLTTALWGIMVMLVGAARSFAQLLLIRVGVAVGEAGCMPPAYSLISDYFSQGERPRAISNYQLGGYLSIIAGYTLSGWLSHLYGWRVMFVILGLPGVVLAPLAWYTLKEPRLLEAQAASESGAPAGSQTILQVARQLWKNVTFRRILAMLCINYFFASGILVWQPTFFVRSYGLSTEELGVWFSVIYGVCGFIGTYCGGHLASRYAPRNERLQLRAIAVLNAGYAINWGLVYLSHSAALGFAFVSLGAIGGGLQGGSLFAAAQTLVPERIRAMSISVIYLCSNLIGTGLGPLLVGALSDALHPIAGQESLRYALLAMCPGFLWGGWQLWVAAETVSSDTHAARSA